jgi:hypothetical protein
VTSDTAGRVAASRASDRVPGRAAASRIVGIKLISRERAANEHAFADLKAWRILAKIRMNAHHATDLLRALLVLTRLHVTR